MACAGTCECDYTPFPSRPIDYFEMPNMVGYGLLLIMAKWQDMVYFFLSVCAKFAGI